MFFLQELIFSVEGFKPFGWYLTLVQFGFYSTFGLIELQLIQDKRRRYDIYSLKFSVIKINPFNLFIPINIIYRYDYIKIKHDLLS